MVHSACNLLPFNACLIPLALAEYWYYNLLRVLNNLESVFASGYHDYSTISFIQGGDTNAELNVLYKVGNAPPNHHNILSNIYLCTFVQVVSTHPYEGEDEDELTFEKGVVILVVPYEDPEDEVELYVTGIALTVG